MMIHSRQAKVLKKTSILCRLDKGLFSKRHTKRCVKANLSDAHPINPRKILNQQT